MATLDGAVLLQPVVQSGPNVPAGTAVTAREGICAFYDLGLTQINVLQEKGQAKSSESKRTEEPPDMLLIEVQQVTPSEEGNRKELLFTLGEKKRQSCKASHDLSVTCDEGEEQQYATPPEQRVVRNPKSSEFQICTQRWKIGGKTVFSCGLCTFTSLRTSNLKHHVKTHSDEKRHVCHLCLKAFRTAAVLHNHVNAHTGTRPHKCSDCDMAFVTSGELSRHRRYKHTLEKPFKCSLCKYASVERRCLIAHQRTHTGEKPFTCLCCSKSFRQKQLLTLHFRKHRDPNSKPTVYECPRCGKGYSLQNNMHKHAENCGLARAKTATPRKRNKGKNKTHENPKRVKQEVDLESFQDVSTVKNQHCQ
ncbi:CCCTC-binding factor (zinc finger protein)-like, transcript variant X2 [Columba livia]|uniref:CCCTC-binding factor (Zinc finger protein)-like, transcript variant X2 n=1 Tax=Columba livia TaxID=8932 RepID=A0A2I0M646_COLLI|nr:CCCTC-binding factor (zinc finger protein)-like, transcript variant X2 [Columba livia]